MCGRYFLSQLPRQLQTLFGTENVAEYNPTDAAVPQQFLPLIVRRKDGNFRMGLGRWGLLPSYAGGDDLVLCAKLKNARSETILEKRSFADLWRSGRRCLIPADGFYEWPEIKIKGHPPYRITVPGLGCLAFAGLWNKTGELVTFTVLTTSSAPELQQIHSRMPVMFAPDAGKAWLAATVEEGAQVMEERRIRCGLCAELLQQPAYAQQRLMV